MDKDIFARLYKAMVRSHLEYGNIIWSPYLKKQSIQIERIQRRATKLVKECRSMPYSERLRYLNLLSLKGRRIRGDLIQIYKIFHEIDDLDQKKKFFHLQRIREQGIKHTNCKRDTVKKILGSILF